MESKEKRLLLINELTDFTKQGALRWEKTSQQGTYMATFPKSGVRISGKDGPMAAVSYALQIIDAKGNATETIVGTLSLVTFPQGEIDPAEAHRPLAELYRAVRQQAETESDKTIDDVFAELKRLSTGAKAS